MGEVTGKPFDIAAFLATEGSGRAILRRTARQAFFSQGSPADCVFYLQTGRAKLTVISKSGKEATVSRLNPGDFFGEESITGAEALRMASASAVSACVALKIDRAEMLRFLHEGYAFSDMFMKFILTRGVRTQIDLVDQLFNSSEKRLARILLLMAEFGQPGEPETLIPPVTLGALAELVGTTRSRVGLFMKRFQKLGYLEFDGRIRVHKSLLNLLLHDELPGENASKPKLLVPQPRATRTAKLSQIV